MQISLLLTHVHGEGIDDPLQVQLHVPTEPWWELSSREAVLELTTGTAGFHQRGTQQIIRRADTRRGLSVSSRPALCFGKSCPVLAKQQSNLDPTADGAEA